MQPSLAILFLLLPRGQIPLLRVLLTRVLPFTVRLFDVRPSVGHCGGRDRGRGRGRRVRKPTTDPAASIVLGDGSDGNGAKG